MTKICNKCNKEKDESEFYARNCQCKACLLLKQKIYNHSEKGKLRSKKSQQSDKNKLRQKIHRQSEEYKLYRINYRKLGAGRINDVKYHLKKEIGETPPLELVEVKLLTIKTKQLCKTLKN